MVEVLAGRYELGRVLGAGGAAQVRAAVDRRLGRTVAVKLLVASTAANTVRARFLQEAKLAAQFNHPHAVTVYDTGEEDGILYLVMALVDGPSLDQVLAERGPLDASEAVAIADQILAAVTAGHAAGLVHRDIKPSNILFTADGIAKLADFGIAKGVGALAISVTGTGQVIGTPQYMSPEQITGRPATPASDLYAVGVVLFEMLTGAPPFSGDTPLATALAHREAPVPSLVERRPDLDRDLAAVVERALAKPPRHRYRNAAAMRAALASPGSATRAHEPGLAATPTLSTRSTYPLHTGPEPPARNRTERLKQAAVVGSLALLAAFVVAAVALFPGGGDGEDDPAAAEAVQPSTTTAPPTSTKSEPPATNTTAPPTTTAPPASTTAPTTATAPTAIGDLTNALIGDPDAHGDKGDNLLDKLQKVQRESGDKQVKEAGKTIEEVEKWAADGKLRPETAQQVISALEPLS